MLLVHNTQTRFKDIKEHAVHMTTEQIYTVLARLATLYRLYG